MNTHPATYVNVSGLAAVALAVFVGKDAGIPLFVYGVGAILLSVVVYCSYTPSPT